MSAEYLSGGDFQEAVRRCPYLNQLGETALLEAQNTYDAMKDIDLGDIDFEAELESFTESTTAAKEMSPLTNSDTEEKNNAPEFIEAIETGLTTERIETHIGTTESVPEPEIFAAEAAMFALEKPYDSADMDTTVQTVPPEVVSGHTVYGVDTDTGLPGAVAVAAPHIAPPSRATKLAGRQLINRPEAVAVDSDIEMHTAVSTEDYFEEPPDARAPDTLEVAEEPATVLSFPKATELLDEAADTPDVAEQPDADLLKRTEMIQAPNIEMLLTPILETASFSSDAASELLPGAPEPAEIPSFTEQLAVIVRDTVEPKRQSVVTRLLEQANDIIDAQIEAVMSTAEETEMNPTVGLLELEVSPKLEAFVTVVLQELGIEKPTSEQVEQFVTRIRIEKQSRIVATHISLFAQMDEEELPHGFTLRMWRRYRQFMHLHQPLAQVALTYSQAA